MFIENLPPCAFRDFLIDSHVTATVAAIRPGHVAAAKPLIIDNDVPRTVAIQVENLDSLHFIEGSIVSTKFSTGFTNLNSVTTNFARQLLKCETSARLCNCIELHKAAKCDACEHVCESVHALPGGICLSIR